LAEGTFPIGEFRCATTAFTALNHSLRLSRTAAEVLRTVLARTRVLHFRQRGIHRIDLASTLPWRNARVRKYT